MPFLARVEADKVQAVYTSSTQKLWLSAEGTIQPVTSRIMFTRVEPSAGSLKFILEGWVGPLIPPNSEPYQVQQTFDIQLPNLVLFSNTVDVVTLNHPEGLAVPIQFVEGGEPGPVTQSDPSQKQQSSGTDVGSGKTNPTTAPAQPQSSASTEEELSVFFDQLFSVKEPANLPSVGTIFMDYDSNFLKLENASLEAGDIVWSFTSLQVGETQVRLRIHGGINQFAFTKTFKVHISFDNHASEMKATPVAALANGTTTHSADSNGDMGAYIPVSFPVDTFLGRISQAVNIVEKEFPDAALSFVDARPINGGYVTDPSQLSDIICSFNATLDGKQGIATIETLGWWGWYPPRWAPLTSPKRPNIPLPIEMDAVEADKLLKQQGHNEPYDSMFLLQQIFEGVFGGLALTTAYQFHLKDGELVTVEAGQKALPMKSSAA